MLKKLKTLSKIITKYILNQYCLYKLDSKSIKYILTHYVNIP